MAGKGRVIRSFHEDEAFPRDVPDGLDAEALARANATVARLREVFATQWAATAFAEMDQCIALARAARDDRRPHLARLARLAHDIKGQGSVFGFPAVTEASASLYRLAADRDAVGDRELSAMAAHVTAMRDVVENRFADIDGALGRQVIDELRRTVRAVLH